MESLLYLILTWIQFAEIGVGLAVAIAFLTMLQRLLRAIPPQHRRLKPGLVWALFIPLFNIGWVFVVVHAVTKSISNTLSDRGIPERRLPTLGLGAVTAAFAIAAGLLSGCIFYLPAQIPQLLLPDIAVMCSVLTVVWIVLFAVYWGQLISYKRKIDMLPQEPGNGLIF
jgi:hypothetical protein